MQSQAAWRSNKQDAEVWNPPPRYFVHLGAPSSVSITPQQKFDLSNTHSAEGWWVQGQSQNCAAPSSRMRGCYLHPTKFEWFWYGVFTSIKETCHSFVWDIDVNGVSFVSRSCRREYVIRGASLERMPSGTSWFWAAVSRWCYRSAVISSVNLMVSKSRMLQCASFGSVQSRMLQCVSVVSSVGFN